MQAVLLHDWLTGLRGGERVLGAFCELFPHAPIYTLFYIPGSVGKDIESHPIISSSLNRCPGIARHYRKLLPLMPMAVEGMAIKEEAKLVLSSSHCVIKGLSKPPMAKHLCYIHSPMRYLYDQYDVYFGKHAPFYQRFGAKIMRSYLTHWDIASNANVDVFVANSVFVKKRVEYYYRREAMVVHPFVELSDFKKIQSKIKKKKDYFVMVTAFAPNKRVDLAINAFNQLKLPLKIIGNGQDEAKLKAMAGPTIEFMGNCSREMVIEILADAQAMIFPGIEDFGITPLEALACGTPVIAYRAGGVLETLNEQVAVFFDEVSVDSLISAIKEFSNRTFNNETLFSRAGSFSKEIFLRNMNNVIQQIL